MTETQTFQPNSRWKAAAFYATAALTGFVVALLITVIL